MDAFAPGLAGGTYGCWYGRCCHEGQVRRFDLDRLQLEMIKWQKNVRWEQSKLQVRRYITSYYARSFSLDHGK